MIQCLVPGPSQSVALGDAIVADNHSKVRVLLAAGTSPDCVVWGWDTALFLAVRLRRLLIVRTLLASGAAPRPGPSGRSPLASAAESGSPELLMLLLQHGAIVEHVPAEPNGFTPLEIAVLANFEELVVPLIAAGADPDHRLTRCFARKKWPRRSQNQSTADVLYLARVGRTPTGRKVRMDSAQRLIGHAPILLASIACGADRVAEALLKNGATADAQDSEGDRVADYRRLRRGNQAASS